MIFCTSTALKVTFVPPAQAITGCAASPTFFALSWHKISISKCRIYSLNVPNTLQHNFFHYFELICITQYLIYQKLISFAKKILFNDKNK